MASSLTACRRIARDAGDVGGEQRSQRGVSQQASAESRPLILAIDAASRASTITGIGSGMLRRTRPVAASVRDSASGQRVVADDAAVSDRDERTGRAARLVLQCSPLEPAV